MNKVPKVTVQCADCGKDVFISKNTYGANKKNPNHKYRCSECYHIFRTKMSAEIWKQMDPSKKEATYTKAAATRKNKTEEEKTEIRNKTQATWASKSDTELKEYAVRCVKNTSNFWNSLSDDERKEVGQKSLAARQKSWENMTEEERASFIQKKSDTVKAYWNHLSDTDRNQLIQNMSDGTVKQWTDRTPEERAEVARKISIGRKNYWNSLTPEERIKFGEQHKQWWDSLPIEERIKQLKPLRIGYREWFDSLTKAEKKAIAERVSKASKKYWDSITQEEKDEWNRKRSEGFDKYFIEKVMNSIPNKNESNLMDMFKLYGLNYEYQRTNQFIYPGFHDLFPYNIADKNSDPSPYHRWDFMLHLKTTDVFVDIDGSVHDMSKQTWFARNDAGKKIDVKANVQFNDAKRPYQTDGLPAYAVLCYDDNLTMETPVIDINTDETMIFKTFITLMQSMDKDDTEIKQILNQSN